LSSDQKSQWYLGNQPRAALLARVEPKRDGFFVGAGQTFIAPAKCKLALRMNDGSDASAKRAGQVQVTIKEVKPKWLDDRGKVAVMPPAGPGDTTLNFSDDGMGSSAVACVISAKR